VSESSSHLEDLLEPAYERALLFDPKDARLFPVMLFAPV